jgi:hypothetical protein
MDDNTISEKTLRMMDKAAINLKDGIAGEPIDLEEMKRVADSLPDED